MAYRSREAYLQGMRGNIWKSYLFTGFRSMMIIMPIIVLFFQDLGLSMQQIFLTQAAFSLTLVVLEIPSGYLSDTLGRKRTLIIGSWAIFLGFLAYVIANGFWEILFAEILIGIGASFISGTDTAMLYDTLIELREEQTYKRVEGRRQSLARLLEGVGAIIGGLLAISALRTPFIAQALLTLPLLFLAYSFVEPEVQKYRPTKGHVRGMADIIKESFKLDLRLKWLIIYSAIVAATSLTAIWLLQPWFVVGGLTVGWFGLVWASMYLVAALASLVAHRVDEFLGPKRTLFSLLLLLLVANMALAFGSSLWWLLVIPAYQIVRALQNVVVSDYLNAQLASNVRATILSARNFLYRIIFAISSPFIGVLVDRWSIHVAFFWSGILFAICAAGAFLALLWSHRRPSKRL